MATADAADPTAAPKKRSLFSKRPAWAAASQTVNTGAADIFTRRNNTYDEIFEKHKREPREVEEKKKKIERKSSKRDSPKDKHDADHHDTGSASKRRRISEQTYAMYGLGSPAKIKAKEESVSAAVVKPVRTIDLDGDDIIAQEQAKRKRAAAQSTPIAERSESAAAQTRTPARTGVKREPSPSQVISLSDDDDEPTSPAIDPDESFPELIAAARQRRKQRALEEQALQNQQGSPDSEFDPVIKVLVTSPLLNTKPLLVHRRLSQRLLEIRQVWCQRQGFDQQQSDKIFLTYKMLKVWDTTTCRSLGIKVDSEGKVISDRPRDVFGGGQQEDDNQGRVHVVAVTAEALEALRSEREEKKKAETKVVEEKESEREASPATAKSPEPPDNKVRLLIKGRGYEDYKVIVRPTTTFERIINAFRKEHQIAEDAELSLVFDGETLSPTEKVEDTEIEDLDSVEIHMK